MGLFSKVSKTIGSIAKNPTNLKNYADLGLETVTGGQADTGGLNGGFSDLLLGKKQGGYSADEIAGQIRAAQGQGITTAQQGLTDLNKALETPADQIIRQQVEGRRQGLVSSAEDARRRAQQVMAQRGLSGSSLGLAQDRSITQNLGDQNAQLNSQIPGLLRNQALQDAQTRLSAGQGIFSGLGGSAGVRFTGQKGSRSGGILGIASSLAPLAGTVAGAMAGGPAGASVGSTAGGGISKLLAGTQGSQGYGGGDGTMMS